MSAPARTGTGGRHFRQIPGSTNVPDRVLRAMAAPTIDHRGPEFAALGLHVLEAVKPVFGTTGPVVIYPASGTGAWKAALVDTLSPGDKVLCFETGHFPTLDAQTRTALVEPAWCRTTSNRPSRGTA
jgi:alanine-glyoxylate transaminase/serine-glyoxylate transaminase/serine-pyruvate transaminase